MIKMTKVKICGITNEKDAIAALKLGADYLGFNFFKKSPRYITKEKAKKIINKLPSKIIKVGVFVNEDINNIIKITKYCSLDMIQLHGDEDSNYIKNIKKFTNKKIIKALRIKDKSSIDEINGIKADYVLLDTYSKDLYGGTGKTFDMSLIKDINNKKTFLSGGLNPDNVQKLIKQIKPFTVDVCSGIEKTKGKKDNEKMKLFIKRVGK